MLVEVPVRIRMFAQGVIYALLFMGYERGQENDRIAFKAVCEEL